MKYKIYGFIRDLWYYFGRYYEIFFLACAVVAIVIIPLLCGC